MEKAFLELSSALTGFRQIELQGTGLAEAYGKVFMGAGAADADALLKVWASIPKDPENLEDLVRTEILDKPRLGPLARSVIKMWYLGSWNGEVINGESYVQGLVWDAIEAHPQGAKQQGFGVWSFPPGWTSGSAI